MLQVSVFHASHSSLITNNQLQKMETLTVGGVEQLIEAEGFFTDRHHPTLQVISIRRIPANALTDVYWVSFCSASCVLLSLNLICL
jgi:hypothetical protein